MKNFDCVIIGGGMVGAASALSLANLGLNCALVENKSPAAFEMNQAYDLRVSAISLSSQHLLEQLDVWQQLTAWRLCPYSRLGVWEDDHAYTEFNAQDIHQNHLGHIVENRLIQLALWQEISQHKNIHTFCPDTVQSIKQQTKGTEVTLTSEVLSAKVVIAADGANSAVRSMAGIGISGWDYQQSAMLINVETSLAQQDITWQQFFPTGPVAMLPLAGKSELGGYASLVWYHQRSEIKRLSGLSNNLLQQEIVKCFPSRVGQVNVLDKAAFPLTRRHANQYVKNGVVLIGDAAHTINPMAGQGVNLGFKDVKALQNVIAKAIGNGECWYEAAVLNRYEQERRKDNLLMMTTMDALYLSFSHPSKMVKTLRNAGLGLVNKLPFAKNKALAYACGL